ncbi:LuxR C-terminal-related transcriptional regulator [Massilia sp. erpn]|uniref:LuxR C-terminal-related transcriptional regulator n=1 Tax=Massilia sp. erpn TaxID=2738142 RepID=UPI0021069617|nr:LuxR C-terminal-related transcriptional regulator [Massilia sp. erpn]UTY55770.1 helix-turn-helix transcriptional regulator [Massilia sp. erpn]
MQPIVILNPQQQDHLLHAFETALAIGERSQFFLWTQGQLQALLPHRLLVCLQLGPNGDVLHSECFHSGVLDEGLRRSLCDPASGLAVRLQRRYRAGAAVPLALCAAAPEGRLPGVPGNLPAELHALGLDNVLVHGSDSLPGGATFFCLFDVAPAPDARHAHCLRLLLPYLHMGLQSLGAPAARAEGAGTARISARQAQIMRWLREGKGNEEIGQLLGISGLTVKNHLQRLYRQLGVSNRAHAVARCASLRLPDAGPYTEARL